MRWLVNCSLSPPRILGLILENLAWSKIRMMDDLHVIGDIHVIDDLHMNSHAGAMYLRVDHVLCIHEALVQTLHHVLP